MHGLLGALTGFLALPPVGIGGFGLIWLMPWLCVVRFGRLAAGLNGAILGAAFAAYSLYGVAGSHPALFAVSTALTGAAFALAGFAMSWRGSRLDACDISLGAAALGLGLLALRLCGVPMSLGLAIVEIPAAVRPARSVGLIGLDVLLFTIQAAAASLVMAAFRRCGRQRAIPALPAAMLVAALVSFASASFQKGGTNGFVPLEIVIVQTAIEPWENAFRSADGVLESIYARRESLRREATAAGADLLVWPESSRPGFSVASLDADVAPKPAKPPAELLHAYRWHGPGVVRSITLARPSAGGQSGSVVPKRYRVPLAERGITAPDQPARLHRIGSLKVGTLICYEAAVPGAAVSLARLGADFIVNVTNDAYLGPSALPLMHAAAASLAAVRSGVPILRVANGGPSVLLLPDGTRQPLLGLYRSGTRSVRIPRPERDDRHPAWTWFERTAVTSLVLLPLLSFRRRLPTPKHYSAGRAPGMLLAVAAAGTVLPVLLQAQTDTFEQWYRMAGQADSLTPVVRLTYRGVTDARQPHRAAMAMVAREFGIPATTEDVPHDRSDRAGWLADHGLTVAPRAGHRPPAGPGVAYGLIPPLETPRVLKVSPDHAPVIFDPRTGRFRSVSMPLAEWLKLNGVHWILPAGTRN